MKSSNKNNGGGVHRPQRTRSSSSSKIYGGGHVSSCCSSHHGCNQQLHHLEQQATVVALDAAAFLRPPTIPISRLAVQFMFCLISLILGFRFTRESSELLLFAANIVQHHHNVGGGTSSSSSSSSYTHHHLSSSTFNFSALKNGKSSGIRSNLAWHISQTLCGNGSSDLFGTLVRHSLPVLQHHEQHEQQHPDDPTTITLPGQFSSQAAKTGATTTHVGRHEILIRPWPHPDPLDVMQAYSLISRIQLEQRRIHDGFKDQVWKPIIAITPTFVRTFQALHLTGLLHTLSLVPGHVIWIVIEAGGVTNETASLLTQARVHRLVHLGLEKESTITTPGNSEEEEWELQLETRLRIEGLRFVWEHKLEGIIVFADESNVHSLQFFDTVQEVNWVGVVSVGMLGHASFGESPVTERLHTGDLPKHKYKEEHGMHQIMDIGPRSEPQVQGPVCDSAGNLVGLHTFENSTLDHRLFMEAGQSHRRTLEWAGFVLNAKVVWEETGGDRQPVWLDAWLNWTVSSDDSKFPDIRAILSDERKVMVLGGCGHQVLLWWARMEAPADSKYISKWTLDSPLEIVVPASSTPSPLPAMHSGREWPSLPPHLPSPTPGGYDIDGAYQHEQVQDKAARSQDSKPQDVQEKRAGSNQTLEFL